VKRKHGGRNLTVENSRSNRYAAGGGFLDGNGFAELGAGGGIEVRIQ